MSKSLVDLFQKFEKVSSTSLPNNVEDKFRQDVTWRLSNCVDLKIQINKLCKASSNTNCYDDSISTIYRLVKDREICKQCPKSVSACPKDNPGYTYRAELDISGTMIKANLCPCKYENERLDTLERITPSDKNALQIYSETIELNEYLKNKGKSNLPDTWDFLSEIKPLCNKFDEKTDEPVWYVLYSSVDSSHKFLPKICAYVAYQFARKGKKVGYISEKEIFQNLNSSVDYYAESAITRFNCLAKRDVLIIERINELPYMNPEVMSKYILPLILERNNAHRVTIFTSTESERPLYSFIRKFSATNLSRAKNILIDIPKENRKKIDDFIA